MNETKNATSTNTDDVYLIGLKWSAYMGPIISLLGIFTNFINICVFLNAKLTDTSYRYMLSNSITTFLYLIFLLMAAFFVGCQNCLSSQTYFAAFYRIFINGFFTSTLAIYRILIDITLATRTLRILKNKIWIKNVSYKWILAFWFMFSLIFYLPQAFAYDIYSKQNPLNGQNRLYYADLNNFGRTLTYLVISNIETSIRLFLAVVVLGVVNFLNVIEFRKRFRQRLFGNQNNLNSRIQETDEGSAKSARAKASKQINRMVIFVSFLNAIGTIPFAVTFILLKFAVSYDEIIHYYNIALSLLLLSYASDIFTYYHFNKLYRSVLKSLIKNLFFMF